MPKTMTVQERTYIRGRLLEEAEKCLDIYGIKKTTVDELVRRVRIPKGTFYLFYESKERLFFDVFCRLHDSYQEMLMAEVACLTDRPDTDTLTELIFRLYKSLDGSTLMKLMVSGELELLLRKLPPELTLLHAQKDDFRMEELFTNLPGLQCDRVPVYSAAIRGVFVTLLYKKEIGEDIFDEALRVLIRGVVWQMLEGVTP